MERQDAPMGTFAAPEHPMGIERDLHDLLHDHDCVIVPHWGGFLTHYRPARLDEARREMHPPGKDLSFNRHLTRNDGMLADRVAKREGIGFDMATTRIREEVAGWTGALERGGRLELPRIGIFFRDAEHNLQFDPDKRVNFLKDAYGLRPVAAVSVERSPAIRRAAPIPATPVLLTATGPWRVPLSWAAAVAALVVFGAAAVWAYRMGGDEGVRWSGLNPFGPRPERTYTAAPPEPPAPVATAGVFTLPEEALGIRELPLTPNDSVRLIVDLGNPETPAATPVTTAVAVPKAEVPTVRPRFHVIGGCFAEPGNAERFLTDLRAKGYPAVRLPQRGQLHPVAFGSYARRDEALDAMAALRADGVGATWLLVR